MAFVANMAIGSYSLIVNDNFVGKVGEFKTREKSVFGT